MGPIPPQRVTFDSGEANLSLERPGKRFGRSLEQRAGRMSGAEVGSGGEVAEET